jgi:hypothetical protein
VKKKQTRFKPSRASLSPVEQTQAMLDYMERALAYIKSETERTGDVPPVWVLEKMQLSATNLGMAAKYLKNEKKKET